MSSSSRSSTTGRGCPPISANGSSSGSRAARARPSPEWASACPSSAWSPAGWARPWRSTTTPLVRGRCSASASAKRRSRGSAQALDDGGVGQAATLAHRLQPVTAAGALQLVEERGHELRARAPERVTEGDGATVDIDLVHVGMVLLLPGQHHGGERLVDLEQVDVVDGEAGPLQRLGGGRDGTGEHGDGVHAGQGEG